MAYTTIDDPSAYFQTAIYTGNGGTISIVNDGNSDLQPDWLWFKVRSHTGNHSLQDSVRGASLALQSDTTSADADVGTSQITAFNSDGFSLSSGGDVNTNNRTYVAWQWKAGTSFSNDASSTSVGSVDSTGSVSTDAGFSIINVVKANTTAHTVAHGLGAVPQMIIGKSRTGGSYRWIVYHKDIGNTHAQYLNETFVNTDSVTFWNDTTPTSSVFSLGTDNSWNGTNIFYCFAEKKGYSKFGTYFGNGNVDGTFVYTGFKPAFILQKNTARAGAGWGMFDSTRTPTNVSKGMLIASSNAVEDTGNAPRVDFLSNGFKWRTTDNWFNDNGNAAIYMAFAENPFTTSTGVPVTAK
jgi:hypothetical protein